MENCCLYNFGRYAHNADVELTDLIAPNDGNYIVEVSLPNGTTKYVIKQTTKTNVGTAAVVSSTTVISFHALTNGANVSAQESTRQLAFYIVGLSDLTQNEIDDLYYCVQQYQTEVITGGRQV
jgi:FAD synthase